MEEQKEVKQGLGVEKNLESWAMTGAEYVGNDKIRVRKHDNWYRIHISSSLVRVRETYHSFDVPKDILDKILSSL